MQPEEKIAKKYIKKELSPLSFGKVSVSVNEDGVNIKYMKLVKQTPINKLNYDQFGLPVEGILNAAIETWRNTIHNISIMDFLIWWLQQGNVNEALDWYNNINLKFKQNQK